MEPTHEDVRLPTLRVRLQELFATMGRPHTGVAFISAYAADNPERRERLDQPLEEPVRIEDVRRVLASTELGRAITVAELRGDTKEVRYHDGPVLTDAAVSWLNSAKGSMPALVAALLAHALLKGSDDADAARDARRIEARLRGAFESVSVAWDIDAASLVRVGRLLAVARKESQVVARTLADATLLLMHRPAWRALITELGGKAQEWQTLSAAYVDLRSQLVQLDEDAMNLILIAAYFPRDGLVPLPKSFRIQDVCYAANCLGFVFPGARDQSISSPLESAPQGVHDSFVLTHMLWPALALRGVSLPFPEPTVDAAPLRDAVGATPGDGGWREVLGRLIARYQLGPHFEAHGRTVEGILDLACGAPKDAPAARLVAPPVTDQLTAAPLTPPAAGPTYTEILESIRRQGVRGQQSVLEELAFLCDARGAAHSAPRIMLIGLPGSGKSTILAALAEATQRPYVRCDSSAISESGWLGIQPADIALMCYQAAGCRMEDAERTVLCLDDIDKLRSVIPLPGGTQGNGTASAFDPKGAAVRTGRQESLLGLLDRGPGVVTFVPKAGEAPMQLRTRGLVIVGAGVFRGLEMAGTKPTDEELATYGFIPEFLSRLPVRLMLQPPNVDDLVDLFINGPDAVVPAKATCAVHGHELVVTREAVRMVAAATVAGIGGLTPRTGAAVIMSVVRHALLDVLYGRAPSNGTLLIGPDEVLHELQALGRPARVRRE